jgi:hypothetical protein
VNRAAGTSIQSSQATVSKEGVDFQIEMNATDRRFAPLRHSATGLALLLPLRMMMAALHRSIIPKEVK